MTTENKFLGPYLAERALKPHERVDLFRSDILRGPGRAEAHALSPARAANAIAKGWMRINPPEPNPEMSSGGKRRKYEKLSALTPEQRRERKAYQEKVWRANHNSNN